MIYNCYFSAASFLPPKLIIKMCITRKRALAIGANRLTSTSDTCADQDIFVRWGGVHAPRQENSLDNVVFFLFLVLNLFYSWQRGSNDFITAKTILFQGSRERPNNFQGVQLFPEGVQMLISIENPYNLWFSSGGPDPLSPSGSAQATLPQTYILKPTVLIYDFFLPECLSDGSSEYQDTSWNSWWVLVLWYGSLCLF